MSGVVTAVSLNRRHALAKHEQDAIRLVAGIGVEGDAHAGRTVQHRSRKRRNPELANLRQVHLIGCELLTELRERGFDVAPGQLGENVLTRDVDLLGLSTGALLRLGETAVVEVTGLRNPCTQLDSFQNGLMEAVLDCGADGELIRRTGVMGVVAQAGEVRPGDPVRVELPAEPWSALEPV